ncbi:NADH:ubiquinone oxidoreductase, NADH-binding (51 kD) subunit [Xenococcus sp. PCC 7305]|uniref:NADH-quinone oxidoreductase subunit NuoF n=1 Tax=Xenococcus sp. PCC 7305 TaxID=102125 RepID=UPI0002AC60CA|nr:NADH-quinone oxidoreductase subunit NuoF [Xenococcus sp. PCC 7305]ELS00798.1 NADH:ubiquinone oxidoreductase, NADH-binding (51 kD) subunit [Xenococcus sp. PCC 7305]
MDLKELEAIAFREHQQDDKIRIRCCIVGGCLSANGLAVKEQLVKTVQEADLGDEVAVSGVGCMGLCSKGPLVRLDPSGTLYDRVSSEDAPKIVASVSPRASSSQSLPPSQYQPDAHPFFTKQLRIVLENSGKIDPEKIAEYIAADGYRGLYKVLREMNPESVVEEISQSGLRGRGGAGYPTGLKWATVAKAQSDRKFIICNADEGDPGAFMDRSILESDPHRVLEGMMIAAYAVGASQGYIYVRGEYPLAINHLQTGIRQAKRLGLLGTGIFESSFDFKIDIRVGAGAFVCGEETALMASIEGKRGIPRPRPPYPAESGLWGCPTLINNVETFANIPTIIRRGAKWFSSIGTENSKGTKVFSLAGRVCNTGLIEVPMGTTLQQIVGEMGDNVPDGGKAKAVQTGGPSGGCIPAALFDTPVDYESLKELGSIMGSGGAIVMDESTNMVEVAQFFMEFCMDESCGKCIPCRAGTVQLYQLLTKIREGKAVLKDLEKLKQLCNMVQETSLCGLGQAAPNPVISTLRHFQDDYMGLLSQE